MLIRFWRATRDEDGQAIVIAAIGILVVAMVVLATVTLGNAIHEKVRLQNAADAAAYSTAAVQARAFNFYAFTNRTMVSHYVAIMLLQSYLVVATFIYSAINTIISVVNILGAPCAQGCTIICNAMKLIPKVGAVLALISRIAARITEVLVPIRNVLKSLIWGGDGLSGGLDRLIGRVVIPAFVAANWVLYLAQYAMMHATTMAVGGGGIQVIEESYRDTGREPPVHGMSLGGVIGPATAFNAYQWDRAHDPEALNANPSFSNTGKWRASQWLEREMEDVDDGIQRAQRVMTEISNATRWPAFVFNRSLDGTLAGGILELIRAATFNLFNFEVHGETKMLTPSWPGHNFDWEGNCRVYGSLYDTCDIRRVSSAGRRVPLMGRTHMPQGGSVVADQWLEIDFLFGFYDMTEHRMGIRGVSWLQLTLTKGARQSALAATHKDYSPGEDRWGWHCSTQLAEQELNLGVCRPTIYYIDREASSCDAPEPNEAPGGNHPWWGITPFMKFNPSSEPKAGTDFHQPNTFIWLHQPPEHIDRDPFLKQLVFRLGGWEAELDTSVEADGELLGLTGPGFHAIARALTYYHRPGNWNEHPNFFNPFWRAKLEPVAPLLTEATAYFGAEFFGELLGETLFIH